MEFRHLRSFVAAAQLEHFGRAAARLAIVQPALSKHIRELEDELGTPLFIRLPRGVRLTEAGRFFLHESDALLAQAKLSAQGARDIGAGRAGRLRLGYVDTALYQPAIPQFLQGFRQRWPAIRLELSQHPSQAQAELLRTGAIDLGFVYHLPVDLPTLSSRRLLSEKVVLAVPVSHPLAARRSVKLAALRDEDFVWIPRHLSPPFFDAVFAACHRQDFEPRILQEGQTDLAILSLVAAGVGLSFCLASAERRKPSDVVLLPVTQLDLTMHLSVIWRTDHTNPALPHFLAQC
jgi:DNA-binding transcriptional LysR family regulator